VTTVGVVGTGRMGSAMAKAVAGAGHRLVLHNRTPGRAEKLASEVGGTVATSPADVAAAADVTVTMLANDQAVRSVFEGPSGLLEGATPGSVLVDMSTVTPHVIRGFEAAARSKGVGLLDAPVSGSVSLAEAGKLTVMVGGREDDLVRARPALEAVGERIVLVGPLGSGAAMKLAVNTVIFGLNQALAEGLVLAEAAGIARELAYDVIAGGAAGAPYVGYKRTAFLDPEGTDVAFAIELAEKDLDLILTLADDVGLELPQARTNARQLQNAREAIGPNADFSAVAAHLRERRAMPAGGGQ
jgi:3-hydroxyisobutyrate dehydrogenase/2-hydroxy-3-oxopropionate reductase